MKNKFIISSLILASSISFLSISCKKKNVSDKTYTINVLESEGGSIKASKSKAKKGEKITLSNVASEGYEFRYYLLDGIKLEGDSFTMPAKDVEISGKFSNGVYEINCEYSEYIDFYADKEEAREGEKVEISYMPMTDYVLSYFMVNDKKISGTSFLMPDDDVKIEAVTEKVYLESDIFIYQHIEGRDEFDARSNWFFEYGEDALNIKVIIKDHFIVDNPATVPDMGYRDNVELLISPLENVKGLSPNNTVDLCVSVDDQSWFRKAVDKENFGQSFVPSNHQFSHIVDIKHYLDKQGFEGYVVTISLSYSIWGLNKDNAQFVVCPSFRNTVNYPYKTYWDFYRGLGNEDYLNIKNHPLLNKDGTLSKNPYLEA